MKHAILATAPAVFLTLLGCLTSSLSQDLLQPARPESTTTGEIPSKTAETTPSQSIPSTPSVTDAIPPGWISPPLGFAPAPYPGSGINMAFTAVSDVVQARIQLGFNHLHAGWEFEAGRCFAAAMQADPNCLPAHWGMAMTLLSPSPETTTARQAVLLRLLDLVEQGQGSELERGYAYALLKFISDGPAAGASAFRKVSSRFPNDPQSAIFAALFSRGGFNDSGQPTPDQLTAESQLEDQISKYPDSPLPLHALLFIRSEGPNPQASIASAQKLCRLVPDYPPYLHLLGHYQWRSGQHSEAAFTFERSAALYHDWMQRQKFSPADCPEWLKASAYQVSALASLGKTTSAIAAAKSIAATPMPSNRPISPGARFLEWEILTLSARLMLDAPYSSFNAKDAAAALPSPEQTRTMRNSTLAYLWIDGLRLAIETRRLIQAKEIDSATDVIAALEHHTATMAETRQRANANGERTHWNRAFWGLKSITAALRGQAAQASNSRTASVWFASAADHQHHESLAMPPTLFSPMAALLGDDLSLSGKPSEAIQAYHRALEFFPNHHPTLRRLAEAQRANQEPEAAAATEALLNVNSP